MSDVSRQPGHRTDVPRVSAVNSERWDGLRRIAAWSGLLEAVVVVVIAATVGSELSRDEGTTAFVVALLLLPGVISGLVSGSRFFALYTEIAARPDMTATMTAREASRGSRVIADMFGDAFWGGIFAGAAGGSAAAIALTPVLGLGAALGMSLVALVMAIAWFTGWAAAFLAAAILSAALGLAVGQSRRTDRRGRLIAVLCAVLLPCLLVGVSLAVVGVQFGGESSGWLGLLFLLGFGVGGEFVLLEPLLWVGRIAVWASVVVMAALVVVVLPTALLRRGDRSGAGDEADRSATPMP